MAYSKVKDEVEDIASNLLKTIELPKVATID